MKHNWEYKTLCEVCKLSAGGDKPAETSKEKTLTNTIPVYSNGIENDGLYGYCSKAKVFNEALTISGRGTIGYPSIKREPFVPIIRLIVAEPNDNIKLDYLYYWVYNRRFSGNGAAIPQLTVPMIKNEIIPVPSMEKQKQIVVELDKINEIISDCKDAIRNLDSLAQSLFYDYFGDPITNPKGWKTLPFDECIYKIKYPIKLQTKDYRDVGLYPIISQEETLISGYTDLEECVYYVKRPVLIFGDHTRIVKYVPFSFALGADGVKILNPVDSIQVKYFYFCLLLFKIPSLGYSRHYRLLKKKEIPVPPMALQVKFAARIEQIEQQKKYLEDTIANMQTLLNSRMDYWFN